MHIDFQGFGQREVDESSYSKLIEILSLDNDLFLDILGMSKFCVPVICINTEEIKSEGPKPYGHEKTDVGVIRYNQLIEEGVIKGGDGQ